LFTGLPEQGTAGARSETGPISPEERVLGNAVARWRFCRVQRSRNWPGTAGSLSAPLRRS
jgi:hypothetical protein